MKVLIFSHKNDIDGMGSVVLAKLAFKEVDYVLCENTIILDDMFNEKYKSEILYNYDMVFITDLCLSINTIKYIAEDKKLTNKILIFDHHESVENKFNDYDFVNIKIKNDKGMCCATSIFYEFLVNKNYLSIKESINDYVELTRQHDTWEWVLYENELANDLSILFSTLSPYKFIDLIIEKLKSDASNFRFNNTESFILNCKKDKIVDKCTLYDKNMIIEKTNNYNIGILFISYEYRNYIAEYVGKKHPELDFCMLFCLDMFSVSLRSLKKDVNVRVIAEKIGGGGHDKASSIPLNKTNIVKKIKNMLKLL